MFTFFVRTRLRANVKKAVRTRLSFVHVWECAVTNVSVASCPSKTTPSGGVIAACSIRTQEEEQLSSSLALATHVVSRAIGRFGVCALSVCMCVRARTTGAIECVRVVAETAGSSIALPLPPFGFRVHP